MGTGRLLFILWGQVDFTGAAILFILWGQVDFTGAAMDAAGMNPRTLALFDAGPIRKSERIKNPHVKHETRSAVQTLSERLGLGASHPTYPAHRRRWKGGTDLNAGQSGKGRNGNGRNADAVLAIH
jgi:hypothetical protein